ncbi:MAG: general secretion pathway protein GspL [Polyangiaceae bacterium]|nr:general secretion pathway protein GspL [Polyangiaceae bacterium]
MAKLLGIDIQQHYVRAVVLRTSFRGLAVEAMAEVDRATVDGLDAAIAACAGPLAPQMDASAIAVDGVSAFIHRLELPPGAAKQISDVLHFELEARIPLDIDELVFDHRTLPAARGEAIPILAAAARESDVRAEVAATAAAIGHQPNRVGIGGLPLANLVAVCSELNAAGPVLLLDLTGDSTDLVVMAAGHAVMARTLSIGVLGLPESAPQLCGEVRQSLAAWANLGGERVTAVYLSGSGASAVGAADYLSDELRIPVSVLPALRVDDLSPTHAEMIPRFAKAFGLALSLRTDPRDLNLRQGSMEYQHGFVFLKKKAPVLGSLMAAIVLSFVFSVWAEGQALAQQNEALEEILGDVSKQAFGEESFDPDYVLALVDRGEGKKTADPQPKIDAFDVMNVLSKCVPEDVIHDVESLEFQRQHVKVRGIVNTTEEAERISQAIAEEECFGAAKISKITQVVNSERQKYVLDFDVKCGVATKKSDKKSDDDDSAEEEE